MSDISDFQQPTSPKMQNKQRPKRYFEVDLEAVVDNKLNKAKRRQLSVERNYVNDEFEEEKTKKNIFKESSTVINFRDKKTYVYHPNGNYDYKNIRICRLYNLNDFPLRLFEASNLRILIIQKCQFKMLPEEIAVKFPMLTKLLINYAPQFEKLPESIGKLRFLKEINISNSCLTSLPKSITECKYLKDITIIKSNLRELPEDISKLRLRKLNISENFITKLPKSFSEMETLETFDCSINLIEEFEEDFWKLCNLTSLVTHNNQLIALPRNIHLMDNLETACFEGNKITELSAGMPFAKQIILFNLQRNKIDYTDRYNKKILEMIPISMNLRIE
jgi:Leucine-rich repeat (LRR) protein